MTRVRATVMVRVTVATGFLTAVVVVVVVVAALMAGDRGEVGGSEESGEEGATALAGTARVEVPLA